MMAYFCQSNLKNIGTTFAILTALVTAPMAYAHDEDNCAKLKDLVLQNGMITEARYMAGGVSQPDPNRQFTGAGAVAHQLPAHCLVRGELEQRTGAEDQSYSIRFEVRLPEQWQHRFIFQGGGGNDGVLANALGTIPIHGATAAPALARGYAVTSMNGGHDGLAPTFGLDQQARLDYAYAAVGKVTHIAKAIITTYYHSQPRYSYFMGCSNGGREAMIAAQRYPTEFDGVVAANPGFHLSQASIGEAWDTQVLYNIAPSDQQGHKILAQALTDADLKQVSDAVLKKCDGRDGVKDGIINDYMACQFDPSVLQCHGTARADCLPKDKVMAIKAIFAGAKDSHGNALYSDWPYDSGINSYGWRMWKLGFSQDAMKPDAFNEILGGGSLKFYFMTPPQPEADIKTFDFDHDPDKINETGALNDATSTMMSTFAQRGSKLLIIQGLSDPVFSANDIRHWYQQTVQNTANGDIDAMRNWGRLFMVPGMTHCGGGPALDDLDPLQAMQDWIEQNRAPDFIPATGKAFPGKSQPICAYPTEAKYQGHGDINALSSYRCE